MPAAIESMLMKYVEELKKIYGEHLQSVILYGSYARGDFNEDSDIDIAVIVRKYTEEMYDRMIDFTVELELEYDKVLSVLLIDYENFREWEDILPFYMNVKKDGKKLWNAA